MQLHPADAEQKLGFHLVRRRLEGHALSTLGRERLAALAPLGSRRLVERALAEVAELQELLRGGEPLPLHPIHDVRAALRRAQPRDAMLPGEELAEVGAVLGTMRRAHAFFRARREEAPQTAALAARILPNEDLEAHIARTVDERGQVRDTASRELQRIAAALAERRGRLQSTLLQALREASARGFAAEEQPTIRNGRAVIPVRAEARRRVEGFVHDVSATGQTVYVEPAAVLDLNNEVRELELERAREIERLLRALTQHLRSVLPEVREGLEVLARLDALQAKARLANELDALAPEINDAGLVRIVRGRNPALLIHVRREAREEGGPPRAVVPLDAELSDATRTLVITGPNAGGKSVALASVGLFALMAACGLPVPAAPGTSLPVFARLFVDIGDQQSIEEDLSTFTSHLSNLRRVLAEADEGALVLIDEAGTGTDPAEGGALAQAVLEALTRRGARTVATTHHGTLKAFAHETPGVENASMEFDRETLAPTYRFQMGVPGSSYAFEIAERVGLEEGVIARARDLAGEQKTALEDLIATFEARTQELEEELARARAEARRAEQTRRSFEGRERALKQREGEILEKALAEADRLVAEANARVERTIREIKEAQAEREQTRAARERLEGFRERVEARRTKARRRAPRPKPEAEARTEAGPIRVGDQVRLDGSAVGEVLELSEREALVALGQMKVRARLERLAKVGGPRRQRVEVRAPSGRSSMPALEARSRIDVRGRRVEEAIPEVMRLVDEAVMAGLERVEVLHGTGTGALRAALREYLATRAEVAGAEDAPWEHGGPGVTVVALRV